MPPEPTPGALPVDRLRAGPSSFTYNSGLAERERLVVRDRAAWQDLWRRIWSGRSPVPPAPDIDFTRDMVVVVALGERPTGGHGILVDSAQQRSNGLTVVVRTIAPGRGCMLTQALTQPVDIARLPRHDGPVEFEDRAETRDCD